MENELQNLPEVRLVIGLVLGLVLGSFTTMLSYRVPRKLSIVTPPSQCPSCKVRLTKRDLIPVLSWLKERGRCRHCQSAIGVRYLLIELVTTAAVTIAVFTLGLTANAVVAIIGIVAFITLVTINLEKHR